MTDPITGKTNYSVAGLKAASEQFYYDQETQLTGKFAQLKTNSGIKKLVKPESIQDKLSRLGIGPDKSQKGPVKPHPLPYGAITNDEMKTAHAPGAVLDEFGRPIIPQPTQHGGKKRKSKRMKSRYHRKYKGKRSNKTRRYRK